MTAPTLTRQTHWVCPNCDRTAVTDDPRPHSQFHDCAGLKGLTAPMVEDGIRCKVEATERGDYLGEDAGWVRLDGDQRPIMNVTTTRDDGTDCAVFPATAHATLREVR